MATNSKKYVKPTVVISKCFDFEACRYDGTFATNNFVKVFEPYIIFIPVCPEVEIGLGTPREPIRIVFIDDRLKLMQPTTTKDLTDEMVQFSERYLDSIGNVDGFILKSQSPSCGLKDAEIFTDPVMDTTNGKDNGIFTAAAIKKFPYAAVTSETELLNLKIRDDFLTKIFTSANFRAVKAKGTLKALEQFHSKNQYLLMAYSKKKYKLLRHILTNPENSPVTTIFEQYEDQLYKTLIYSPSLNTTEYVFMHSIGHLRTRLSPLEKTHLMGLISNYKLRKIPFKKLRTTFKSTIAKYKEKFLMEQTFFSPYPVQLE